MYKGLKLIHVFGMILFLGSILTFVLISTLIEGAGLEEVVFGRKIISTGTSVLTLPGMWMLAVTGILTGYLRYGFRQRYLQIKLLIMLLIVCNAYLFVVPAVSAATELAEQSLASGQLLDEYVSAYMRESLFGAVNVLLVLAAAVVGVWRIGIKNET